MSALRPWCNEGLILLISKHFNAPVCTPSHPQITGKSSLVMVREDSLKKERGGGYFITCIFSQYKKSFSSKIQMFQLLPVEYYSCHNLRLLISLGIWTNKKWSNIESGGAAKKYIRFVLVASWQYREIFVGGKYYCQQSLWPEEQDRLTDGPEQSW